MSYELHFVSYELHFMSYELHFMSYCVSYISDRRCKLQVARYGSKYRLRSKTQSSRKSRRIFFRGFFTPYPKPKTRRCKPRRFSLRHFDQTLRYFDQTPSFPFCTTLKTENSEMETSEFSLRLFVQTSKFSISVFSVWSIVE